MERVDLEDLDASVEVPWGNRRRRWRRPWTGAETPRGLAEAVGYVEVEGTGGGEVVFEALLADNLGFGMGEEDGGAGGRMPVSVWGGV